jgi:iron complex transport system substrate-binding protein
MRVALHTVLLLCMLCCCSSRALAQTAQNAEPLSPQPTQRVVTLAPHLTELVAAAGGLNQLVAVSRYSDYPAAVQGLPVIGDAFAINYEALIKLRPTLVLAWKGGTPARQVAKLKSLKLDVVEVELTRIDHIALELRALGKRLGTASAADDAARLFEQQVQALRVQHARQGAQAQTVFYQVWSRPLMTVGGAHVISEAIELCGGRNVFADIRQLTATVSAESVAARLPQHIVSAAAASSRDEELLKLKAQWQALDAVPAVRHQQLHVIDADLLSRMGPRLPQGITQLCSAIAVSGPR